MTGAMQPERAELVLASAGTGKTFQLAMRVIRLLAAGTRPDSILAVTFTRKAAAEIAQRVLRLLAEGATGAEALTRLRQHVDPALTATRAADLASSFARSLHEFGAMTIDGFMARTARLAALDLDAPPGWSILEAPEAEDLSRRAVAHAAEELGPATTLVILDAFAARRAAVNVEGTLAKAAARAHRAYEQSRRDDAPWNVIGPEHSPFDDAALQAIRDALARASLPLTKSTGEPNKRFVTAREAALRQIDRREWSTLLDGKFAPGAARGEHYYKAAYPDDLREPLALAVRHAAQMELERLRVRNLATLAFVRTYDASLGAIKRAKGAFEFDDVPDLLLSADLTPEQFAYRTDRKFRHVLLDEFQDTSLAQFEVLRPIMAEAASGEVDASLFCVGDAKQSLYTWRNAEPALLASLEGEFSMTRRELTQSHRSSQAVLDAVNRFAEGLATVPALERHGGAARRFLADFRSHSAANPDRQGVVRAFIPGKGDPDAHRAAVIAHIRGLLAARPGCTIGVLMRSNKGIPDLVRGLRAAGVEASQEGGGPLRDSSIVRAVWTMLQLAQHPEDTAALDHLLRSPLAVPLGLGPRSEPTLAEAERVARVLRSRFAREGVAPLLRSLRRDCFASLSPFEQGRFTQLVEAATARDDHAPGIVQRLQRFIEEVPLDRPSGAPVRVMSIHASKGLEFEIVVLPDLEAPLLHPQHDVLVSRAGPRAPVDAVTHPSTLLRPYCHALELAHQRAEEAEIYGELCVLYVALTRAIHEVDLFLVARRFDSDHKPTLDDLVTDAFALPRAPGTFTESVICGDPDWRRPVSRPAPAPAARPLTLTLRPARRAPASRLDRLSPSHVAPDDTWLPGAQEPLRASARDSAGGRRRGELLHAILAGLDWLEAPPAQPPGGALQRARGTGASDEEIAHAWRRLAPSLRAGLAPVFAPIPGATLRIEHPLAARVRHDDKDVLVAGRLDRLVLLPGRAGAWIVDFKSDRVESPEDEARLALTYAPQLRLYARAVARAYGLAVPAIRCTLALLGPARLVDLSADGS